MLKLAHFSTSNVLLPEKHFVQLEMCADQLRSGNTGEYRIVKTVSNVYNWASQGNSNVYVLCPFLFHIVNITNKIENIDLKAWFTLDVFMKTCFHVFMKTFSQLVHTAMKTGKENKAS